jgi:uncharacterized lipoprotein YmbA
MSPMRLLPAAAILLAACGSTPVPEVRYYSLPPATGVEAAAEPVLSLPIRVEIFRADGLHSEQGVLYATSEGGPVRTYHYQLWNDTPGALLQKRLIARLRAANYSTVVAARLPGQIGAFHITGDVQSFQRVRDADGNWRVEIRLELRADVGEAELPVVLKTYEASVPADSDSMQATVRAFASGVDEIYARFLVDLAQQGA